MKIREITVMAGTKNQHEKDSEAKGIPTKRYRMKGENKGRRNGMTVNTLILCSL